MKHNLLGVFPLVFSIFILSNQLHSQHGTLDERFGQNGVSKVDYNNGSDGAYALTIQSNDKIVIAGDAADTNFYIGWDASILRLNVDGSVDNNFGVNGWYRYQGYFGENRNYRLGGFYDVTSTSTGSIIAVGSAYVDGQNTEFPQFDAIRKTIIIKLKSDGTPDESFGSSGVVLLDLAIDRLEYAYGVELDESGNKIYVCGKKGPDIDYSGFVLRLLSDGSLDVSFGEQGVVTSNELENNAFEDLAVLSDGSVIVTGYRGEHNGDSEPIIFKYNADGNLDFLFGNLGKILPFANGLYKKMLLEESENKLFVSGYEIVNDVRIPTIRQYDLSGTANNSFGNNGVFHYNKFEGSSRGWSLAKNYYGDIVFGLSFEASDLGVLAIDENGVLDESWGEKGEALVPFGIIDSDDGDLAMDSEGRIVAVNTVVENNSADILALRFDSFTSVGASSTAVSCSANADGSITIQANEGDEPFSYSLDGDNYQESNVFENLSEGNYTVYVKDANATVYSQAGIQIAGLPGIEVSINAQGDQLVIIANGGTPPYEYSIDGVNFQSSASFTGWDGNTDNIVVRDAKGCSSGLSTGIEDLSKKSVLSVYPNPAREFIRVEGAGQFKSYVIYGVRGEMVKKGRMGVDKRIDIKALEKGSYLLVLENGYSCRVMKY